MVRSRMDPSDRYTFRAPTRRTLTRWSRCCSPTSVLTTSSPRSTRIFSDRCGADPAFDLAADGWVAIDAAERSSRMGRSAGKMATASGRGVSFIPSIGGAASVRRSSIGSKREPRQCWPARRHHGFATRSTPPIVAAAAMLTDRGLRPIRHFWHMQIDLDGPVEPGPAPDGIEIAGIEPRDDLRAIHGIIQAAFVDDPVEFSEPFDRWAEEHTSGPELRPDTVAAGAGREASRSVPSPRAPVMMSAGWTTWPSSARIGDAGSGRRLLRRDVRDVRCSRARARQVERRCRERDRCDGRLRARRDARRQPMGPVGTPRMKTDRAPQSRLPVRSVDSFRG